MRPQDLVLRCLVQKEADNSWFAICIDLNLSAQADTLPEVKHKLHEQIHQYMDEATGEDSEYFEDLVPRLASFSYRLKYRFAALVCSILDKRNNNDRACTFTDHLPLKPA